MAHIDKVFIVSGHVADAGHRVGLHFWAKYLEEHGVRVDFLTVGLSGLTFLRRNARAFPPPYNSWTLISDRISRFVWRPLFHPFSLNNRFIDALTTPLFATYPFLLPESVKARVREADVVVIESGVGVVLTKQLRTLAPKARFIYNYSDRLQSLAFHPLVIACAQQATPLFDMIRVPAEAMIADFPKESPVRYLPQGLDTSLFDAPSANPYDHGRNAISVGDGLFNPDVISTLAAAFPDWRFHLFGKKATLRAKLSNVIEHGQQPFETLVPYLKHADIGIVPYRSAPDIDYYCQSSLKMVQYTYCSLPIVAPAFAAAGRRHVMAFRADAERHSLISAFRDAIAYDRKTIDRSAIMNWDEVGRQMFGVGAGGGASVQA